MNNAKLQEWALIAEVIGGIAIVVTLVFLVRETQENTNAIQAQTYQALTAELNDIRTELFATDLSVPYLAYLNEGFDALSEVDQFSIIIATEAKWGVYESAFYARERDILGTDEWQRFESAICRNFQVDQQLWRQRKVLALRDNIDYNVSDSITPLFLDYVETQCSPVESPAP